ncbi:MAG: hypothetical protein IKC36_01375 [Clostridia bacterium]|nr:hypothetical protein [Clostridia bacterium]
MQNVKLNFSRLTQDDYSIDNVFQPADYDWPGDFEGRALLAFACHYEINGSVAPCMHPLVNALKEKTNSKLYFGKEFDGVTVDEQQLSGHNWYLRGLIKYAENFNSELAMQAAKSTVENLYLPALSWFSHYPLERASYDGGVFGNCTEIISGWKLSTDIGCAFMCFDGLAKYYQKTSDARVKSFLDTGIELFKTIDLVKYKFQTHTSLTFLRGVLTLYQVTGDASYLDLVKEKFLFYVKNGMTLTYENFNWFGREDTWTEPCAVTDSLILSIELFKETGEEQYKTLARRIWFNGLQFCQRINGGAGPNTCVTPSQPILSTSPRFYEAHLCCTMRYAEALLYFSKNEPLFTWNENGDATADEYGRRFIDDVLLVKVNGAVTPIFSCNTIEREQAEKLQLLVIF